MLDKHLGVVADDADCVLTCVLEDQRSYAALSVRYVEDEAAEWAELDYSLKVTNHLSFIAMLLICNTKMIFSIPF